MSLLKSFLLNLFIFNLFGEKLAEVAKTGEIAICPTFCYCDLFDGLNRANCSSRQLSISNVADVPLEVEILDLSNNLIFQLDKNSFEKFIFLKNLTLSHNYIGNINPETFNPLRSVTTIDLSHNGLNSINEKIIKTNRKLQRLNLSGNRFSSLRNKPLLRSPWLRSLKLRNSKIGHLYPEFFLALPNLRELDVSANNMLALNIAAFRELKRLEYLNLTGNFWGCPPNALKVVKLLQKRDIKIESAECYDIMHLNIWSETDNKTSSAIGQNTSTDPLTRNAWHHMPPLDTESEDDDQTDDAELKELESVKNKIVCEFVETEKTAECNVTPEEMCYKYRKCLKDRMYGKKIESGNDLYFIFLIGFAMGIIFVICFISGAICLKRWCASRRKKPDSTENNITESEVGHTARPLIRPSVLPTVERTTNAQNRQTTNQRNPSTPTALVNLFNNPLSQHLQTADGREQERTSGPATRGPIPTAPSFSSEENADQAATVPSFRNEERSDRRVTPLVLTTEQPAAVDYNKPDTPPPSYSESITNVRK